MEDGPSFNSIETSSNYCLIVTLNCSGVNNNSYIQEVDFMLVIIPIFLLQCSPAGEIYIFLNETSLHRISRNIKPLSSELNNNHLFAAQSSYGKI